MKRHTYDDKLLTEYLLGSLSEQETEELDQLSFTDNELASRLQEIENDLVDAYARGDLSGPTLERFNSHYLASPKRREKVAFAREFQGFLSHAAATEKDQRSFKEPAAVNEPARTKGFPRRYFFTSGPAMQWGLAAAALIMLLVGGWLAVENRRLQNQMSMAQTERLELQKREQQLETEIAEQRSNDLEKERELRSLRERLAQLEQQGDEQQSAEPQSAKSETEQKPNIVSFTLAPQMRGVGRIATVSIPADADSVAIQLELEPSDFTSYRVELKTQPLNVFVWRSGTLRAQARGDGLAIAVSLRPSQLKSQMYSLELYGVSSTGAAEIIGNYPFRVVRQ